jgi:hypothetical protein
MHIHSVANMSVHIRATGGAGPGDPALGDVVLRGRQSTRALKRKLLQRARRTLVCGLAALAWSQQSFADDTTNAALIGDPIVWGQSMHQVMGGTSATLPGAGIAGPMGIYAVVQLADKITAAKSAANSTLTADKALTNYFGFVLANPAVSGLLVLVKWKDLEQTEGTYLFDYLDDALDAIDTWNAANPSAPPKTLQLAVTPGFNAPDWLFDDIDTAVRTSSPGISSGSCDGLFTAQPVSSSCGYTNVFQETEGGKATYKRLPLPWNSVYKTKWQTFLYALEAHIGSEPSFVSISVAGPTASSGGNHSSQRQESTHAPERRGRCLHRVELPVGK